LKRVRLSYNFPWFPILRQTPGSSGVWEDTQFVVDDGAYPDNEMFDGWVVYNNLAASRATSVCPENSTFLVVGEPPSRGILNREFASQFATVLSCHSPHNRRYIASQPAVPWWVGLSKVGPRSFKVNLTYDDLKAMTSIRKTEGISIICSSLDITPHHRQRLRFLKKLQAHFGSTLKVFGDGFEPIDDKWLATAPYRYQIVLENSIHNDYWTEKLSDSLLGAAWPIYCGCPNIVDYFPGDAVHRISIADPADAIRRIAAVLDSDPYDRMLPALWEARRRVLDEYNFFSMINRYLQADLSQSALATKTVHPSRHFSMSPGDLALRFGRNVREAVARPWFRTLE
jgi:hypothetical protein